MRDVMALFDEQVVKGNEKFIERFIAANEMNCTSLEEVARCQNRRRMPQTWGRYRHPATMYLK